MINLTFTVGIPLHCPGWDPTTLLFHLLVVLVGIPPLFCFTCLLSWLGSHHSLVLLNLNMYGMVAFLLDSTIPPEMYFIVNFVLGSLGISLLILTVATNAVFQNVFHCQFWGHLGFHFSFSLWLQMLFSKMYFIVNFVLGVMQIVSSGSV